MIHTIEFFMHVPINQIDTRKFIQYNKNQVYYSYSKGVKFSYDFRHGVLSIKTTVESVIGRIDVTINDYDEYVDKLTKIVSSVVERDVHIEELQLKRIDYKIDILLTDDEMEIFKNIKNKHYSKYKYMTTKQMYDTSVHINNKKGQYNLNSYDKYEESKDMRYWNVWRIEVQVKMAKIRKNLKKDGISRELSNYWNMDTFNENFFDLLEGYFFKGDYYKLDMARDLIRKSNYSKTIKNNLCKFVNRINRYGMTGVKDKYYNYVTMKKYCELLDNINVNPVTIELDSDVTCMENMLKKAKRIVAEKYSV